MNDSKLDIFTDQISYNTKDKMLTVEVLDFFYIGHFEKSTEIGDILDDIYVLLKDELIKRENIMIFNSNTSISIYESTKIKELHFMTKEEKKIKDDTTEASESLYSLLSSDGAKTPGIDEIVKLPPDQRPPPPGPPKEPSIKSKTPKLPPPPKIPPSMGPPTASGRSKQPVSLRGDIPHELKQLFNKKRSSSSQSPLKSASTLSKEEKSQAKSVHVGGFFGTPKRLGDGGPPKRPGEGGPPKTPGNAPPSAKIRRTGSSGGITPVKAASKQSGTGLSPLRDEMLVELTRLKKKKKKKKSDKPSFKKVSGIAPADLPDTTYSLLGGDTGVSAAPPVSIPSSIGPGAPSTAKSLDELQQPAEVKKYDINMGFQYYSTMQVNQSYLFYVYFSHRQLIIEDEEGKVVYETSFEIFTTKEEPPIFNVEVKGDGFKVHPLTGQVECDEDDDNPSLMIFTITAKGSISDFIKREIKRRHLHIIIKYEGDNVSHTVLSVIVQPKHFSLKLGPLSLNMSKIQAMIVSFIPVIITIFSAIYSLMLIDFTALSSSSSTDALSRFIPGAGSLVFLMTFLITLLKKGVFPLKHKVASFLDFDQVSAVLK